MRIAMVDPSLFTLPYDDHLCRGLFDRGHSVTLFTRPLREDEPRLEFDYWKSESFYRVAEDPKLKKLPHSARLLVKGVEHSVEMAALAWDLRRFRPDVIHFQWMPVPLLDRFYAPLLRKIAPTFLTVHDTNGFLAPTSKLQLVGWRGVLDAIDQLIVHLESSKAALVNQGISSERISVAPHGVLTIGSSRPRRTRPPRLASDDRTILLFGTIKHYKGADILLRAFAELPESVRTTARIKVVGQPFVDMNALRALADELGIADRVEWDLRFVDDDEIPDILASADVMAFPYRRIDASGVLMMVLPYERPVVATRVGCFEELLDDDETAFLAPVEDHHAFAAALERALTDHAAAARVAGAARELALEQMSWDAIAGRTVEIYRSVISRVSASTPPAPPPRICVGEECFETRTLGTLQLIRDEETIRSIGELMLAVAFADDRFDPDERESILAALRNLEGPRRASDAKRTLSMLLERLDLRQERLEKVASALAARLDESQRALVVDALFLVAVADGRLVEAETRIIRFVAEVFAISEDRVDLLFGSQDWT